MYTPSSACMNLSNATAARIQNEQWRGRKSQCDYLQASLSISASDFQSIMSIDADEGRKTEGAPRKKKVIWWAFMQWWDIYKRNLFAITSWRLCHSSAFPSRSFGLKISTWGTITIAIAWSEVRNLCSLFFRLFDFIVPRYCTCLLQNSIGWSKEGYDTTCDRLDSRPDSDPIFSSIYCGHSSGTERWSL